MALQTYAISGRDIRDEVGTNPSQAIAQADPSTEGPIVEIVSALPPAAVEYRKKAHDEVFGDLVSISISTSPVTSVSSLALPLSNHSDSTPLLASAIPQPSRASTDILPQQSSWTVYVRPLQYFQQWLGKWFGFQQASHPPVTLQSIYDAIFLPTIQIEIDCGNYRYPKRAAVAMIDFQCDHNLISRNFGDLFFDDLDAADPYPLIATLGPDGGTGGVANAIKKVHGRWKCTNNPTVVNPWLKFDNMMLDSEFHIMERRCRYDIIIGAKDIVNFDLLGLKKRLNLVASQNFRSLPYHVNAADAQAYDEAVAAAQQSELEQIRLDRAWMAERDEHAHRYAQVHSRAYANAQVARLGPTAFRDAYDQTYGFYYAEGEKDFQQRKPRPNRTP